MDMDKFKFWGRSVSKTVTKTCKVAGEKSGKLIEEGKLRIQIAVENDKISEKLEQIGSSVYEDFKSGASSYADFEDACKEIEASEVEILKMKTRILDMKKLRLCPVCSAEIAKDDKYCSKCGAEQEAEAENEEKSENSKPELCPYCNEKLAKDADFCSKCGTKIE